MFEMQKKLPSANIARHPIYEKNIAVGHSVIYSGSILTITDIFLTIILIGDNTRPPVQNCRLLRLPLNSERLE